MGGGASSAKRICPAALVLCQSFNELSFLLARDEGQNLLGESYHNAARKGQKAVRPLGRVVGFKAQAHLHDAEAEHNHTDSPHQTENEVGEVVDNGNRVVGGKGGCSKAGHTENEGGIYSKPHPALSAHRQLGGCFLLGVLLVEKSHGVILLKFDIFLLSPVRTEVHRMC